MSIGVLFWLILLIGILFGAFSWWGGPGRPWGYLSVVVVLFEIALIGYKVFGFPFHD